MMIKLRRAKKEEKNSKIIREWNMWSSSSMNNISMSWALFSHHIFSGSCHFDCSFYFPPIWYQLKCYCMFVVTSRCPLLYDLMGWKAFSKLSRWQKKKKENERNEIVFFLSSHMQRCALIVICLLLMANDHNSV